MSGMMTHKTKKVVRDWWLYLLGIGLASAIGLVVLFAMHENDNQRRLFSTEITQIDDAVIDLQNQLGYGGFIHNFKNAVLRPSEKDRYLADLTFNVDQIMQAIARLEANFPELEQPLVDLVATLNEYAENAELLSNLDYSDPLVADRLVRVSDDDAISSLLVLLEQRRKHTQAAYEELVSRSNTLYLSFVTLVVVMIFLTGAQYFQFRNRRNFFRYTARMNAIAGLLIERTGSAILQLDSQGNVILANEKAKTDFGFLIDDDMTAEEAILLSIPDVKVGDGMWTAFSGGAVHDQVVSYNFPDGSFRHLRIFSAPIAGMDGADTTIVQLTDITSIVSSEQANQRTRMVYTIGHLARGIVHDFRNVIGILRISLKSIERRIDDTDTREMIENAREALDVGSGLADRLLNFSKSGGYGERDTFGLATLLSELEKMGAQILEGHGVIVLDNPFPDARISGNYNSLLAALINLVVNAQQEFERTSKTDGLVRISVTLSTTIFGSPSWNIVVADNGEGFPPELLSSNSVGKTTKTGGFGVGLQVVKALAAEMAGQYEVKNNDSGGATISLNLPAAIDPSEQLDQYAPSREETLVLVEDHDYIAAPFKRGCQRLGINFVHYTKASDALANLPNIRVDFLITDFDLAEEKSGYDVVAWAKANLPDTPIVVFTKADPHMLPSIRALDVPIINKAESAYKLQQMIEEKFATDSF
ncbi:hypothetical protein BVC71_12790 [Marivivens niveibacter]|uniref:histidine kinase n=1 Tax=Marivivens niveibacter TaxID=1930667 RepID=A0A251WWN8_9RHOB|nr:ATP-binding protein [Marivivens niveibacter]OUD08383.1 hypothetical protein BVC71_12790 [Marivivens niveibacter]